MHKYAPKTSVFIARNANKKITLTPTWRQCDYRQNRLTPTKFVNLPKGWGFADKKNTVLHHFFLTKQSSRICTLLSFITEITEIKVRELQCACASFLLASLTCHTYSPSYLAWGCYKFDFSKTCLPGVTWDTEWTSRQSGKHSVLGMSRVHTSTRKHAILTELWLPPIPRRKYITTKRRHYYHWQVHFTCVRRWHRTEAQTTFRTLPAEITNGLVFMIQFTNLT
jgi:hypothetical protein